jgi:cytochrome b subunit of formate dehydrogenase
MTSVVQTGLFIRVPAFNPLIAIYSFSVGKSAVLHRFNCITLTTSLLLHRFTTSLYYIALLHRSNYARQRRRQALAKRLPNGA